MSTPEVVENVLTHFGTKGMKWGVRRERARSSGQKQKDAKRLVKADKKFEKKAKSVGTWVKINNAGADHFNARIGAVNDKPEYQKAVKNGDLLNSQSPAYKKYHNEVSTLYFKSLQQAAAEHGGTNPSGTKKISVRSPEPYTFEVVLTDVKHDASTTLFKVKPITDAQGRVIGIEVVEDSMTQSSIVDDILEHHGVKGMRWGVRRKATVGPQEVIVSDRRVSKRIKTTGGKGHPAHSDATTPRKIGQVGKKSGLKALSNDELEAYNRRLNLEQNTKRLMYHDSSPPTKFIKTLLGQTGKQQANEAANAVASKQVKKLLAKAAIA